MEDENKEQQAEKTPAEIMKELQEAHAAEMATLRKQLEEEKAAHARDVKELLLSGKRSGASENEGDPAKIIAEKMRKKYYK